MIQFCFNLHVIAKRLIMLSEVYPCFRHQLLKMHILLGHSLRMIDMKALLAVCQLIRPYLLQTSSKQGFLSIAKLVGAKRQYRMVLPVSHSMLQRPLLGNSQLECLPMDDLMVLEEVTQA